VTIDAAPAPAPARGRPRDRRADDRILHAAFEQLIRVGYGSLSMESVATDAGVAKTTVYRRYSSKRELVLAAVSREVPYEAPSGDLPTRDALELFVRTTVLMLVESGAIRVLASLLVEDQREPGLLDAFRERVIGPRQAIVVGMLERGVERGELRPDIDARTVTELVAGATFAHHLILGQPTTDAWIDSVVDHVWRAIESGGRLRSSGRLR
jgi:AcrR family transcriptional regulator